jgi:iron(III) transport system substrate-binding protein
MDRQMELVLAGHALPHRSPEAPGLPPGATYRDLAWSTTVEPLMTLVNRDLYDTRLPAGSLPELTAALRSAPDRFQRRVACYDIERNGLGFLALLHESRRSAEFDAFLQVLAACRPWTFGSNPPLVEEVASGRAALAYHVLGSYALRAARAHPALAVAATAAAPLAVSRVAFIPARAPHPGAARLFIDYLLSEDGQRRLGEAGLFPIRRAPGAPAAPVSSIAIDRGFEDLLDGERRRRLLARWQAAVAGNSHA